MSSSLPSTPRIISVGSSVVTTVAASESDLPDVPQATVPRGIRGTIEYSESSWDSCVIDDSEPEDVFALASIQLDRATSHPPTVTPLALEPSDEITMTPISQSPCVSQRILAPVAAPLPPPPALSSVVSPQYKAYRRTKRVFEAYEAPSSYWPPSPFTLAVGAVSTLPVLWVSIYAYKHIEGPSAKFMWTPNSKKNIDGVTRLFTDFYRSLATLATENEYLGEYLNKGNTPIKSTPPSAVILQSSSTHLIKSVHSFVDQVTTVITSSVAWSASLIRNFSPSSFDIPSHLSNISQSTSGGAPKDHLETPVRIVTNNALFYCEVVLPRFIKDGFEARDQAQALMYGLRLTKDVFPKLLDGTLSKDDMRAIVTHMMVHADPRHLWYNVAAYAIEASALLVPTYNPFMPQKHVKRETCEGVRGDGKKEAVLYITTTTEIIKRPACWWSMKNTQVLVDSIAAVSAGVFGGIIGGLGSTILFNEYQKKRFLSHNHYSWEPLNRISENVYNSLSPSSNGRQVVVGGSAVVHSFGGFVCGYRDKPVSLALLISVDIMSILAMSSAFQGIERDCGLNEGSSVSALPITWGEFLASSASVGQQVGHAAHIGGSILGYACGVAYRKSGLGRPNPGGSRREV